MLVVILSQSTYDFKRSKAAHAYLHDRLSKHESLATGKNNQQRKILLENSIAKIKRISFKVIPP